jgi:hypothetical protein
MVGIAWSLAAHQKQMVLLEQAAQFRLVLRIASSRDVEIEQLDSERIGQWLAAHDSSLSIHCRRDHLRGVARHAAERAIAVEFAG